MELHQKRYGNRLDKEEREYVHTHVVLLFTLIGAKEKPVWFTNAQNMRKR